MFCYLLGLLLSCFELQYRTYAKVWKNVDVQVALLGSLRQTPLTTLRVLLQRTRRVAAEASTSRQNRRQSPQVGKPFRQFLMGETSKTRLPTLLRRYRYANTTALSPQRSGSPTYSSSLKTRPSLYCYSTALLKLS
ncbi:hypothetical protein [Halotia branconii]|uniref:Uncharacterized protein n=1 Tax=Halotia branconii CENA392 TaxID=1539056 RepID=A0AAJ6PC24_9CYAN|nr:hypothetical protein [Halotia branconii]WGV28455.1 hypothetical protein QI031_13715 [Halotia branconii CENA392]